MDSGIVAQYLRIRKCHPYSVSALFLSRSYDQQKCVRTLKNKSCGYRLTVLHKRSPMQLQCKDSQEDHAIISYVFITLFSCAF